MRRRNILLLSLGMFLLLLPIYQESGVRFGVFAYFDNISGFITFIIDPKFVADPIHVKILASILIVQFSGWVTFAISLTLVSIYGLIRNKSMLKTTAILSCVVFAHGILEVVLALSLTTLPFAESLYSRFGLDFSDFQDDYDALLNSTLVPIGLIVWYLIDKQKSKRAKKLETAQSADSVTTENSSS